MVYLGCSEDEAHTYLQKSGGNVLEAIETNLKIPEVSGTKYIPPPPKIDDGLTPEVREKIHKAREIAEMFSVSFRNDLRVTPASNAEEDEPLSATFYRQREEQDQQEQQQDDAS